MDWARAAETAGEIAAAWTEEGGPGGAILLFDADDIRAEACGGFASIELRVPFAADTAMRFASISKHFLASLVLSLPDAIRLNDRLGAHLPPLQPALGNVLIGHALDMTGGLPDVMETLWLLGVPITAALRRDTLFHFVTSLTATNFPPGTEISYSNTGYRLIEAALEARGIAYEATLRERFCRPLGLEIRLPEDWQRPVPSLATGYWKAAHGWERGQYGLHFSASGGLAGSARDLAAWLQALLADRAPVAGLLQRLSAPRHLVDGRATQYGLGLAWSRIGRRALVGHGGSLPGYKNHFLLDPENRCGALVLSNREDTDALDAASRVMAALLDETLPPPITADALPDGLFAAEREPFWLQLEQGRATFLGAQETLYAAADGWAVSHAAHLPMRLRATAHGIDGEIGHVARHFTRVAERAALPTGIDGEWGCPAQHARFAIENGALHMGAGPLRVHLPLTPLGSGRALIEREEGPWRQRACLVFSGAEVLLVSNRSRMLRFVRKA